MNAPLPPADIDSRVPEFTVLRKGVILERFFSADFDPIYFDRSKSGRLNAPDGSYGVLYAAQDLGGAFAETFLRNPGQTMLTTGQIAKKARVQLRTLRELRLVKLGGAGLARIGATAEIIHGAQPYDAPQTWSRELRLHPSKPDGIAYTARHDDESICYALFDHLPLCVGEHAREMDIDRDWFWDMAEHYGVQFGPS